MVDFRRQRRYNDRAMVYRVTDDIVIDERDIRFNFIRSSGPGGQNVNKVATAVQLRYDLVSAAGLTDEVRTRLIRRLGRRVSADGILVIEASRFRSQERNRRDALERLVTLVGAAAVTEKRRRPTRPGKAAKERRLEAKKHRGERKRSRGSSPDFE